MKKLGISILLLLFCVGCNCAEAKRTPENPPVVISENNGRTNMWENTLYATEYDGYTVFWTRRGGVAVVKRGEVE